MNDSHATLIAEIVRLKEQNKALREKLALTKVAKGQSPKSFDALIDKWLEESRED